MKCRVLQYLVYMYSSDIFEGGWPFHFRSRNISQHPSYSRHSLSISSISPRSLEAPERHDAQGKGPGGDERKGPHGTSSDLSLIVRRRQRLGSRPRGDARLIETEARFADSKVSNVDGMEDKAKPTGANGYLLW